MEKVAGEAGGEEEFVFLVDEHPISETAQRAEQQGHTCPTCQVLAALGVVPESVPVLVDAILNLWHDPRVERVMQGERLSAGGLRGVSPAVSHALAKADEKVLAAAAQEDRGILNPKWVYDRVGPGQARLKHVELYTPSGRYVGTVSAEKWQAGGEVPGPDDAMETMLVEGVDEADAPEDGIIEPFEETEETKEEGELQEAKRDTLPDAVGDAARELRHLVLVGPSTITNARRIAELRSFLRSVRHPDRDFGLLPGGSDEGVVESKESEAPAPTAGPGSPYPLAPQLWRLPPAVGLGSQVAMEQTFLQTMLPQVASLAGARYNWYPTAPNHYWSAVPTNDVPAYELLNPGKIEVDVTSDQREAVKVVHNGIYRDALAYADGRQNLSEISSNLRVSLPQVSGNTETQHASLAGARALSGYMPSTARIPFAALVGMASTSRLDYSVEGIANGSVKNLNQAPAGGRQSGATPLRPPGAAVPAVMNFRIMTMADFTSMLSGGFSGQPGFDVDSVMSGACAVIPIRSAWLTDGLTNMCWVLAHMEWPWSTTIKTDGAAFLPNWNHRDVDYITTSHYTHIPGPLRGILVLSDLCGVTGPQAGMGIQFWGNGAPVVIGNGAVNANTAAGADLDLFAQAMGCSVGGVTLQSWWGVLQRWNEVAGNQFDWDTAWISMLEIYGIKGNSHVSGVSYTGEGCRWSWFSETAADPAADHPPSCGQAVAFTRFVWPLADNSAWTYTTMSGQVGRFDRGDPGPNLRLNHMLRIPGLDPLMWTGAAARFYRADRSDFTLPGSYSILLGLAMNCPKGWALMDQVLRRGGWSYLASFTARSAGAIVTSNLERLWTEMPDRVKAVGRNSPAGGNAFSPPFQLNTSTAVNAAFDTRSMRMAAPNRISSIWAQEFFVDVPDTTISAEGVQVKFATNQATGNPAWFVADMGGTKQIDLDFKPMKHIVRMFQSFSGLAGGLQPRPTAGSLLLAAPDTLTGLSRPALRCSCVYQSSRAETAWVGVFPLTPGASWMDAITQGVAMRDSQYWLPVTLVTTTPAILRTFTFTDIPASFMRGDGNIWLEEGAEDGRVGMGAYFRDLPI